MSPAEIVAVNAALAPLGFKLGFAVEVEAAYIDYGGDQTTPTFSDARCYFETPDAAYEALEASTPTHYADVDVSWMHNVPHVITSASKFTTVAQLRARRQLCCHVGNRSMCHRCDELYEDCDCDQGPALTQAEADADQEDVCPASKS